MVKLREKPCFFCCHEIEIPLYPQDYDILLGQIAKKDSQRCSNLDTWHINDDSHFPRPISLSAGYAYYGFWCAIAPRIIGTWFSQCEKSLLISLQPSLFKSWNGSVLHLPPSQDDITFLGWESQPNPLFATSQHPRWGVDPRSIRFGSLKCFSARCVRESDGVSFQSFPLKAWPFGWGRGVLGIDAEILWTFSIVQTRFFVCGQGIILDFFYGDCWIDIQHHWISILSMFSPLFASFSYIPTVVFSWISPWSTFTILRLLEMQPDSTLKMLCWGC